MFGLRMSFITRDFNKDMLNFLSSKVHYKVPKTYFYINDTDVAYLGMEIKKNKLKETES